MSLIWRTASCWPPKTTAFLLCAGMCRLASCGCTGQASLSKLQLSCIGWAQTFCLTLEKCTSELLFYDIYCWKLHFIMNGFLLACLCHAAKFYFLTDYCQILSIHFRCWSSLITLIKGFSVELWQQTNTGTSFLWNTVAILY